MITLKSNVRRIALMGLYATLLVVVNALFRPVTTEQAVDTLFSCRASLTHAPLATLPVPTPGGRFLPKWRCLSPTQTPKQLPRALWTFLATDVMAAGTALGGIGAWMAWRRRGNGLRVDAG